MQMVDKGRSRLGRGLNSLISISSGEETAADSTPSTHQSPPTVSASSETSPVVAPGPIEISLASISPNPHQPRRHFDDSQLSGLAESLKSSGLIQPIVVKKSKDGYQLIAGERRLRAARIAGFAKIPAIFREVDENAQAQLALVENIQREDLNPLDRAAAYQSLIDHQHLTQAELAQRLGEDRSGIANYLRLLSLTKSVQDLLRNNKITFGHAKLLASVDDPLEQERLANLVATQELSVRNLERTIAEPTTPPTVRNPKLSDAYITDLEKNISRQLGMRVQVRRGGKGKGRLTIHYASLDQFDQLLAKMGLQLE
jgi:ParB family transcriptional regulator, chromosome partitioning protein